MAARYILPALAVAGRAAAEVCSGTTTISTQAEATGLASCSQFNGDIWIASNTNEDIDLSGIQRIDGSLLARKVQKMTSLSADTLSTISDTFGLDTISSLTSLSFPALVAVDSILWSGLPSLQGLSFTQQVQKASTLSIQNTNLATLEGIDLQMIDFLQIANNPFLDEVNMQLGNVTEALSMAANGRNIKVSFPNLEWARNMTFRNVSSLDIPSLAVVNKSAGFYSNFFDSISAPNLTAVGGSLAFVSNGALTNISFPELKALNGGLQIANNTKLGTVDGFPRLSKVFGDVDLFGVFKSVKLPDLSLVLGAFNLYSTQDLGNTCAPFQTKSTNQEIRGKYMCQGHSASAAGASGSGGSGGSGGGSGKSGANSVLIPYATGFIGLVAAIFGML